MYVTSDSFRDTVSVIDEATNKVTHTIPVGSAPYGVAVDPAARTAYVTNYSSGTVSVIDEATNTGHPHHPRRRAPPTEWRWTRPPTPPT